MIQPDAEPVDETFAVVFVCTGNRFRSPLAAAVFERLTSGLPVEIRSLGTLEIGSVPPLLEAIEHAARIGLDLDLHRARSVSGVDLRGADVVLGFEQRHVAAAVVECGAPREHAFTLPELADLVGRVDPPPERQPVARGREVVARSHALRAGLARALPPELGDPFGGSAAGYERTATTIENLCRAVAAGLFGVSASARHSSHGIIRR